MKVENEILEQESHLRLREVATIKKMHLTAARTIDKLKEDASKEEHEWRDHTHKIIEDLRHDNQHLQKLHDLTQVNAQSSMHPSELGMGSKVPHLELVAEVTSATETVDGVGRFGGGGRGSGRGESGPGVGSVMALDTIL
ncbi:hypothetical protein PRIC1_005665 [Phytophthora ramorum]